MASKVMIADMDEAQSQTLVSPNKDVSQTLGNMDFEHNLPMMNLEVCRSSDERKRFIRAMLVDQHRERREPYVTLLSELRRHLQHPTHAA